MALGQHKVDVTPAADQIHLLDEGAEIAAGYSSVGLNSIFGGTLGFQIDRREIVAVDLRLRAFVDRNALHAVDGQQVEQRMAPYAHIEWNTINISLDFAARTAYAHPTNIDSAPLVAAKTANRVVTRYLYAGSTSQCRRQICYAECLVRSIFL